MTSVFADTFYFLALLNPRDKAHAKAVSFAASFQDMMVSTAWVITELADALCLPANRGLFIATYRDLVQNPQFRLVPPEAKLFQDGLDLFEKRADKSWSLSDCISFVVMSREGITEALTGDKHFEQAGFVALLK
jgi:predicted nucleic acid-binding protein